MRLVNKKTRLLLSVILAAVFAVTGLMYLGSLRDKAGGQNSYEKAAAIASGGASREEKQKTEPAREKLAQTRWIPAPVEDDPMMEEMAEIDLAALREVNPDVIGWIRIPETVINYPLMQGSDNDYYLHHTWEYEENAVGSIFLEHLNNPDLMDYNTIVYGHNMVDGSMFGTLSRFGGQTYWENHPYIYITCDAGVYRYEVFSSYQAPVDSVTYGLSFQQTETKREFLQNALDKSLIQSGLALGKNDRILTLSTCSGASYANRWVVHARMRLVETAE